MSATCQEYVDRKSLFKAFVLIITVLVTLLFSIMGMHYKHYSYTTINHINTINFNFSNNDTHLPFISSGWDASARQVYNDALDKIQNDLFHNKDSTNEIRIAPFTSGAKLTVYGPRFWSDFVADKFPPKWEPETYNIYFKYINSDTILIDFGTWIGPTVLYGAQFAYKVYGIEADPAAFAEVSVNVKLNKDKVWYKNIHIHAGGVSSIDDAGQLTMTSYNPGKSCSGFGDKVGKCGGVNKTTWKVDCHTLEFYLQKWKVWNDVYENNKNLFIKIDIESYECKLVPDFYEWLIKIPKKYLPTFYISYHPHLQRCSDDQYVGFVRIVRLYSFMKCGTYSNKIIDIQQLDYEGVYSQVIRCNNFSQESIFILYMSEIR